MMAATVSGSKTCQNSVSPQLTAEVLTELFAIAPENLTIAELQQLLDASRRVSGGSNPNALLGTIFI
jgi:hypothetical protein